MIVEQVEAVIRDMNISISTNNNDFELRKQTHKTSSSLKLFNIQIQTLATTLPEKWKK
jgi:hypothetical protein